MLTTLPWWAWLLSGVGSVVLIWLVVGLAISRPRRRALTLRLDEQQQQLDHLGVQRADREARVASLELRLAESEHLRLAAETAVAEREAALAEERDRLRDLERLQIEVAVLHERAAALEEDVRQARERARTLEDQREALLNERDHARTQREASDARRDALEVEVDRLRLQLTEARYAAELHAAHLRVAEGEHEANVLAALRGRQIQSRSADLLALSAFADELAEYRIGLKQARRRLDQLQQNPESLAADTAAAAAIGAEISTRSADLRAMAAQFQLIADPADLLRGDMLDADTAVDSDVEPGSPSLARDLLGYLRDTFGRLPLRMAPPISTLPDIDAEAGPDDAQHTHTEPEPVERRGAEEVS